MAWMTDATAWLGLGTLVLMELVLGIDNLIFIAIMTDRLPPQQRNRARVIGLLLALGTRLALLSGMSWLQSLTTPLFAIHEFSFSPRDLVLIAGGFFLLAKGTIELHSRLEPGPAAAAHEASGATFWQVIVQIIVLDVVFSLDSVITAIGMVNDLPVMMLAIVIAIIGMIWAGRPLMDFVSAHVTVIILCLSFLLMIGLSLVLDGFGFHLPKGYLYAAIAFSIAVEFLNQTAQRNRIRHAATGNLRARAAEAVLRILGGGQQRESYTEDLASLVAAQNTGGIFGPAERFMMARIMSLGDRPVGSIMTPSPKVVWLDLGDDPAVLQRRILETGHIAYPVCRGRLDDLVGVGRAPDLVKDILEKGGVDTSTLLSKPATVRESDTVLHVIEQIRHSGVQIAIVTDEAGAIQGVVTPTDILEAIIGEYSARHGRRSAGLWHQPEAG